MNCVNCGHELKEGALFCSNCGQKVVGETPESGAPLYQADIKVMLKPRRLVVYQDRTEFIASSVQKTIFGYSGLVAVKKGLDRIYFITEDGRTESCPTSMKNVHEAFFFIDQASKPYIEERRQRLLAQGIKYSFVSSQGLTGGIINISDDKAEFKAKTGQVEIVSFKDVKAVGASTGTLDFQLIDGVVKSFAIDKEIRDEVFSFVSQAIEPYLAERKEWLLSNGIYYSSLSSFGSESGTLDIFADKVEFKGKLGHVETLYFTDIRESNLRTGTLDLALTNGQLKSFSVEVNIGGEIQSFIENAIKPYVMARTVGFDASFGIDERIELNEERGVFHIIRQGGREITDECSVGDIVKCEWTESNELTGVLGGVVSGGMAILRTAAKAVGNQAISDADEMLSYVGVILSIRTDQGVQAVVVRFGDFPAGLSRTNRKYDQYVEEGLKFMDYLRNKIPECELIEPSIPEPETEPVKVVVVTAGGETKVSGAIDVASGEQQAFETIEAVEGIEEKDEFGIIKYIEGISRFIDKCATPMNIAIQGNRGNGENSVLKILFNHLQKHYQGNVIWLNARQLFQPDSGEPLSMFVGKKLMSQLSGEEDAGTKDRAVKIATGIAKLVTGAIASDSSVGQDMAEGIFNRGPIKSMEQLTKAFSEKIKERATGGNGKVILFLDSLDKLTPVREVELLDAMRSFFECKGCVFVIAAEYATLAHGVQEQYGPAFDEDKGKSFFDEIFQMSFRVPVSSYNIENYVKNKLEHIGISVGDGAELNFCVALIKHSVGNEPGNIDRLFDSFLLLKNMADEEMYESHYKRLVLFALLCMQARYYKVYDFIVRMKDKVTPDFLSEFCSGQSKIFGNLQLSDEERTELRGFVRIFSDIINRDGREGISESECSAFTEVLEFSSITSK